MDIAMEQSIDKDKRIRLKEARQQVPRS
jgi:hypothetical protein